MALGVLGSLEWELMAEESNLASFQLGLRGSLWNESDLRLATWKGERGRLSSGLEDDSDLSSSLFSGVVGPWKVTIRTLSAKRWWAYDSLLEWLA